MKIFNSKEKRKAILCFTGLIVTVFFNLQTFAQDYPPWTIVGNSDPGNLVLGRHSAENRNIYFLNSENSGDYDMVLTYDPSCLGIGTTAPHSKLHIHSEETYTPGVDSGSGTATGTVTIANDGRKDLRTPKLSSESAIHLTNHFSGSGENDGFLIRSYGSNAVLHNQEEGDFTLINDINGNRLILEQSGALSIGKTNQKHLIVTSSGNVGVGTDEPTAKLELIGNSSTYNYLLGLEQGYGIFSDNVGNGIGGSTRLWLNTPDNGSIVFGPRSGESELNNIRFRSQISRFEGNMEVIGTGTFCQIVVESIGWCDYVFNKSYQLLPLCDLELYIKENKHLPGIPSEDEISATGIDVANMTEILLKKIEELTLYIIEQEKEIEMLKTTIEKNQK